MPEQQDLSGIVQPGKGLGAGLMSDRTVMEKLEALIGLPIRGCGFLRTSNTSLRWRKGPAPCTRFLSLGESTRDG
jgi:hypothetical protein